MYHCEHFINKESVVYVIVLLFISAWRNVSEYVYNLISSAALKFRTIPFFQELQILGIMRTIAIRLA